MSDLHKSFREYVREAQRRVFPHGLESLLSEYNRLTRQYEPDQFPIPRQVLRIVRSELEAMTDDGQLPHFVLHWATPKETLVIQLAFVELLCLLDERESPMSFRRANLIEELRERPSLVRLTILGLDLLEPPPRSSSSPDGV